MSSRIRVVIAKPGLDGHDRGAKVIARALRDAGMEVIYTGLRQTPEQIVTARAAGGRRRDRVVDPVGRPHAHLPAHRRAAARAQDGRRPGGCRWHHPDADVPKLNAIGITGVFQPGTPMQDIVEFIRGHVTAKVD
jgi:methylmalonyl-CoA mutase C-terminal domain/subunit